MPAIGSNLNLITASGHVYALPQVDGCSGKPGVTELLPVCRQTRTDDIGWELDLKGARDWTAKGLLQEKFHTRAARLALVLHFYDCAAIRN